MRRRNIGVIGLAAIAVMFVGTLVYAGVVVSSPGPDGTIHACYDERGKGAGKIRIVTEGTPCKPGEEPLQWRAMASLNELDLTTCTIGGTTGTTTLEWDADGYARFKCEGATPPECTSGDARSCYTGPPGTENVGVCSGGTQTCTGGTWGSCIGEVTPSAEACDLEDDDCDGAVDDECSADVDECSLETDTCDTNATCENTVGSFNCTCNEGYTGDGTTCTDIDECEQQTDNCDVNATCTDTPGSFSCQCAPGFQGDGVTCTPL